MPKKPSSSQTPQERYSAANIRRFVLNCNRVTMPDLLSHLEAQPNVQRYLISLIQADMEKQNNK